jgi:dephospho-CoA kinase
MLRVGLTGELGSGKSTVARMLAARGAIVLSSDEMARARMQPGQPVFAQIVAHFGPGILAPDGTLDRARLAALAFDPAHPRIAELNALVHPPVLAAQAEQIAALAQSHPDAVVAVESALLLSDPSWRDRFDRILVVTAPEEQKIARFVARAAAGRALSSAERAALEADARRRLAAQRVEIPPDCLILQNGSDVAGLEDQVRGVWESLQTTAVQRQAAS